VEAGRLRSRLRQYYASAGPAEPSRIELPTGTYRPVFHSAGEGSQPAAQRRRISRRVLWLALAALAATGAVAVLSRLGPREPRQCLFALAVLPVVNITGNPELEAFCDGLTDQLTQTLSTVSGFQVASRTAAFQFKGKALDIASIGRKLRADAVLESSAQKSA